MVSCFVCSREESKVNRLEIPDGEMPKVKDERKVVKKVEFRDAGPIVKHFDCRVMYSSHPVTKGYAERKKRDPIFDAFGIGGGADAIRGNAHITMLHRDNGFPTMRSRWKKITLPIRSETAKAIRSKRILRGQRSQISRKIWPSWLTLRTRRRSSLLPKIRKVKECLIRKLSSVRELRGNRRKRKGFSTLRVSD